MYTVRGGVRVGVRVRIRGRVSRSYGRLVHGGGEVISELDARDGVGQVERHLVRVRAIVKGFRV